MSRNRIERALIEVIEQEGGLDCRIETSGKHHKIWYRLGDRHFFVPYSQSPGTCRRSLPHKMRLVRQDVRRNRKGVEDDQ